MEFMEPKDIDWSRVVSRYVRDETYEGIEAPHWADLTDPNAGRADIDDEAWFCRPGTPPFSLFLVGSPRAALLLACRASIARKTEPMRFDPWFKNRPGSWSAPRSFFLALGAGFRGLLANLELDLLIRGAADCRHPKTAEDFVRLSPSPKVCPSSRSLVSLQAFLFSPPD
jgi:hypothetical protein